jgi:hypothetical protein
MLRKLLLLTFLFVICTSTRNSNKLKLSQMEFNDSICPVYENCLFYQANANLTDYDCSVCRPEYTMKANEEGRPRCEMKNEIPHCIGAALTPEFNATVPFCFECEQGYILSEDLVTCTLLEESKKIQDCKNYYYDEGNVVCNACIDGFTLNNESNSCQGICNLNNCQSCEMYNNETLCYKCNAGFIGKIHPEADNYSACMSCFEYQTQLKLMRSNYRPS